MEASYFPSPVWNSSFDDNDASTTLDTSIETENDSMAHYEICNSHRPKMLTSRSSPGAPLNKENYHMMGYFDDVDSFTSKSLRLQYDNLLSPKELPSTTSQSSYFQSKASFTDGVVPADGETVKLGQRGLPVRRSPGFDLEVMHESDEGVEVQASSPAISTPPLQIRNEFGPSRRSCRSHTSQGIPSHSFLGGLDAITEDKTGNGEGSQGELEQENDKLRSQLEATRNRLSQLEEQMSALALRLEVEKSQSMGSQNGNNNNLVQIPPSPHRMVNYPLCLLSPGPTHYVDGMGHTTTDTGSIASLSMTPDPFSPFQRFSHNYSPHPNLGHHEGSYPANLGFPSGHIHSIDGDESGTRNGSSTKAGSEYRMERSSKTNSSDLQLPAEVLVAKTLGAKSQDASIALQQQLKSGTPARKTAIIQAITSHVLRLADDKHGNFLVQRAVSVHSQVAWELKGHFVALSLSQFGCHVVQRILDEESIRATVVEELLSSQVSETLTCRNSIHVKVLEINWPEKEMRAKIFKVVNGVMKGRWAETAMQETGSIICQNIFESADEGEREDCVKEILERLCECAANQWGVWVVQHIIEHGDSEHRAAAFAKLLGDAVALTLSQYGQKAVMSALKSRDPLFIDQYVDILCESEPSAITSPSLATTSSRRSILVDISSAPQGVQIVTQLLTSVQPLQRDRIIKTVRKNSVFLKGSKAGLRVHQLCERARAFTGY